MSHKTLPLKRFDRWTGGDLPFLYFRNSHNEINRSYWAYYASRIHTFGNTRPFAKNDPALKFFAPAGTPPNGIIDNNMTISMEQWCEDYTAFDDWCGLSVTMSLCGMIETYLSQAIEAAILSDPGLLIGTPGAVDGLRLMKDGKQLKFNDLILSATKGDWPSRISNIEKVFGSLNVGDQIGKLEEMRNLRNDFGHAFGRKIDEHINSFVLAPFPRMPYRKVKRHLEAAYLFISSVDQVVSKHIGAFHVLRHLHKNTLINQDYFYRRYKKTQLSLLEINCRASKSYTLRAMEYYVGF